MNEETKRTPRITSVLNIKGGVGKTITAEMIGRGYASEGKKTLLVDADGQGDLSDAIMPEVNFEDSDCTLANVLSGEKDLLDCIVKTDIENLYLIPNNMRMFEVVYLMQNMSGGDFRLSELLEELDFDEIVIDNNPSVNKITFNAIYASDVIICPTSIGKKTIKGVTHTRQQVVNSIKGAPKVFRDNHRIEFRILLTQITRNKTNRDIIQQLRDLYGDAVFETVIRFQQKPVQIAEFGGTSLLDDTKSGIAEDYRNLLDELMKDEER